MQNRLEMAQVEREGQVQEAVVVASAETAGPEPRPGDGMDRGWWILQVRRGQSGERAAGTVVTSAGSGFKP